jgi:hypothetical protein
VCFVTNDRRVTVLLHRHVFTRILTVRFEVLTAASMKMSVVRVVAPCSLAIALMMEAASTSETPVNFYHTTRRNNPEGSLLQLLTVFIVIELLYCYTVSLDSPLNMFRLSLRHLQVRFTFFCLYKLCIVLMYVYIYIYILIRWVYNVKMLYRIY